MRPDPTTGFYADDEIRHPIEHCPILASLQNINRKVAGLVNPNAIQSDAWGTTATCHDHPLGATAVPVTDRLVRETDVSDGIENVLTLPSVGRLTPSPPRKRSRGVTDQDGVGKHSGPAHRTVERTGITP